MPIEILLSTSHTNVQNRTICIKHKHQVLINGLFCLWYLKNYKWDVRSTLYIFHLRIYLQAYYFANVLLFFLSCLLYYSLAFHHLILFHIWICFVFSGRRELFNMLMGKKNSEIKTIRIAKKNMKNRESPQSRAIRMPNEIKVRKKQFALFSKTIERCVEIRKPGKKRQKVRYFWFYKNDKNKSKIKIYKKTCEFDGAAGNWFRLSGIFLK